MKNNHHFISPEDDDESILVEVCTEAQIRFAAQIELRKLSEQHWKRMRGINK